MKNERMFHLWGWILFLICACFFMVSAIESRDTPGIIGSGIFIAACFLFLIPLMKKDKTD